MPRSSKQETLAAILPGERARLVGLCLRLTGDPDAAEDLAQETLYEAWRLAHKLHDPAGQARWLAAIARNLCLRWHSRRGREASRLTGLEDEGDGAAPSHAERLAGDGDIELELERHELAELLDRALALLPAETRAVLIGRYVEGSPHAEIAARLGLSEGAVKMRLKRGTLALRHVLTTDLREEAVAYGLAASDDGGWRETRVWCSLCGRRRVVARFSEGGTEVSWHCPGCGHGPAACDRVESAELFDGVTGFRRASTRFAGWLHRHYRPALPQRAMICACGRQMRLRTDPVVDAPPIVRGQRYIHARCGGCGAAHWQGLVGLALALPEARRFVRDQRRIRRLPEYNVESAGRAAVVTSFQSVTSPARLDVVSARDTFELLDIHGVPGGADG